MDKEIGLQKIQTLEGYFQMKLNAAYSMFISFVVGYILFLGSLYYQGVFRIFDESNFNFLARTGNILIFTGFLIFPLYYLKRKRLDPINALSDRCLEISEELIAKVEKREILPSIMELKKMVNEDKGKRETGTEGKKGTMEKNKEALTFFMGAMVGFVGSIFVTSMFEFAKIALPNGAGYALFYWGLMLILSSIAFFQLTKKTLGGIGISEGLRQFDWATGICVAVGIVAIIWAILLRI